VGGAAVLAGLLMPLLTLPLGLVATGWASLGLSAALAYNWPLKSMIVSPLPYFVAFAALVTFVVGTPIWWLVTTAALLGGGAHFANVLPDLVDDAQTGVRGLPHRLGFSGSWIASGTLLLAATVVLVVGPAGGPSWVGIVIVICAATLLPLAGYLSRRTGSRAAFRIVLLIAMADVVLMLVSGIRA
jgi:4-hydroxybenzoate polyprenyltransferase